MKKIFAALLCGICLFGFPSCTGEKDQEQKPDTPEIPDDSTVQVFTALTENTKTSLSGSNILWAEADKILLVLDDDSTVEANLTAGAGTATGTFSAKILKERTALYAVYPVAAFASVSAQTVNVTVPAQQAGTFAAGNIAVAKVAAENTLNFKNVNAFLAFQLQEGSPVTKVEVSSVDGSVLVGTVPVDCSGEAPVPGTVTDPASAVSMTTGGAGTYYLSVASGQTHAKGLKMSYFVQAEETGALYLDQVQAIEQNSVYALGGINTDKKYFVTVEGAGNKTGMDWANAFSKEEMWNLLTLTEAQQLGPEEEGADPQSKEAKIAAIDGATFHLAAGEYDFGENPRIDFTEENPVTLTLMGGYNAATGERNLEENATVITGARNAEDTEGHFCLKLRHNMNVTLDGLHFENGLSSDDKGGALNCSGEDLHVALVDCVIRNNKNIVDGADKNGAGLYLNTVGSCVVTRVIFSDNTSLHAPALYVYKSDITLTDCVFENNYASSWGGAVRIREGNPSCVFNNCTFNQNSANGDSACIVQNDGTMTFNGCTFTKNTSNGNGGAITMNGEGTCIVKGGTFSENAAKLGGAIYTPTNTKVNTVTISDNCTFSRNYAIEGGWAGAIHFKSAGTLTVTDCTFSENYSAGDSGAFNSDNAAATFTFTRTTFSGNHADGDAGGVMWISKGVYNFKDCVFDGNFTAASGGGAVYINDEGSFTFDGCQFTGNYTSKKDKLGGAVYIKLGSEKTATMLFKACTFDGNTAATGYGGAFAVDGAGVTLHIQGGAVKNGYARHGGAILARNNASVLIDKDGDNGTLFLQNYADNGTSESWGGAILVECKNADFTCIGATFKENHINYTGEKACYGGAVAITGSQNGVHVNIEQCVFEGNYSACNGGAALSYQSTSGTDNGDGTGYMRVIDTRFEGNHTDYDGVALPNETGRHGGAVRLGHDGTDSYFDGCSFINNYTESPDANRLSACGGAVTFYSDGMGHFNNCYFEGNHAARGGAISAKGCPESGLYLNGCSFSGNWNSFGGGSAIFIDKIQKFCMNNCSFNDNTYTTSAQNKEENTAWVYADGDSAAKDAKLNEVVISNCTVIGTCRTAADTEFTADGRELVYFRRFAAGGKMHMINNCMINTNGTNHDAWWTNAVDLYGYYNVFHTAGRTNGSDHLDGNHNSGYYNDKAGQPTFNNKVKKEDLLPADIAWDATGHVWPWNGGLANEKIYEQLTAEDFDTLMDGASAGFYAWLQNVDPKGPAVKNVLHRDQLGNARGDGAAQWRPGAYQGN